MSNALTEQLDELQVAKEQAVTLKETFMPFFDKAEEWREKAMEIVVTDANQVQEMNQARDARLALKEIRVSVDKRRKALKEESLRTGKAIDGMANVIKSLIVPIEEHLQKQEDFAKIQKEKEQAELKAGRIKELSVYGIEDFEVYGDLGVMPDPQYAVLLQGAEASFKEAERLKQEEEERRVAKERAEQKERERMEKENERLRKQREKEQAKLRAEQEERRRLEAELKEKEAAEQAELKAKEEAEKKAARAPDKEKLLAYAAYLEGNIPSLSSFEAVAILEKATRHISSAIMLIKNESAKL